VCILIIINSFVARYYPHMSIGKVWIYYLLFVCSFVCCLFVCTVTDFSAEDKGIGVKFCKAVGRRSGKGIPIFVNFAPLEA